jgi:riboflavin kinase/FMN adenylyltransferase
MVFFRQPTCDFKHPTVTMGTFDGVHLGHQKLLAFLQEKARDAHGEAIAISYYHHPLEVIHKKTFPYLLTERQQKEKLIKQYGADCVLFLNFTKEMAALSAYDFLEKILIEEIHAKQIIVGYDTHFAKYREGTTDFLKQHEADFGYKTYVVKPVNIHNRIISSSMIRDFIREGSIKEANYCMGRRYTLLGTVERGQKIGREIGFRTLNIQPLDEYKLIPALGVYATQTVVDGKTYKSVTNIGYSPTLKKTNIKEIETHLLDFNAEIYGKKVELLFIQRIRDEAIFSSEKELINAIQADIEKAKQVE